MKIMLSIQMNSLDELKNYIDNGCGVQPLDKETIREIVIETVNALGDTAERTLDEVLKDVVEAELENVISKDQIIPDKTACMCDATLNIPAAISDEIKEGLNYSEEEIVEIIDPTPSEKYVYGKGEYIKDSIPEDVDIKAEYITECDPMDHEEDAPNSQDAESETEGHSSDTDHAVIDEEGDEDGEQE